MSTFIEIHCSLQISAKCHTVNSIDVGQSTTVSDGLAPIQKGYAILAKRVKRAGWVKNNSRGRNVHPTPGWVCPVCQAHKVYQR